MPTTDPRPNIAFIVSHPDDVAFSFGGTAWLLKDRYRLHVFCATQGDKGYRWEGAGPTPPSPEVAATRAQEEANCCAVLGAKLTFLGLMDGEIFAGREVCRQVAAMLDAIQPVAVFTHGPLEKVDHAASYGIATQALSIANLFWTTELYMVLEPGLTRNAKFADVYVNISPVVEEKRRLIRCHRSHLKGGEADVEKLLETNRALGRMALTDYAESYMTGLALIGQRWNRKAGCILMDLQ